MKRSLINSNIEWAMELCKEMHFKPSGFCILDAGRVGKAQRRDAAHGGSWPRMGCNRLCDG